MSARESQINRQAPGRGAGPRDGRPAPPETQVRPEAPRRVGRPPGQPPQSTMTTGAHSLVDTLRTGPQRLRRAASRRPAAYHVPDAQETGWSAAPSKRRSWTSRAALSAILLVQIGLTLRLHNTAFQDEALYLFAGNVEIDHFMNGTDIGSYGFENYFSGAPQLYPVLGGIADNIGGLAAARLLSLVFMLASTALLYSFTRRLFNERAGLCAAALFVSTQSSQFMGYFATYDALSVFLIAFCAWLVIRTGKNWIWAGLLAAPVLGFAVAVKYASALFIPTVVALGFIVVWQHRGLKLAFARAAALSVLTGICSYSGLVMTGVLTALKQTTTQREEGTDTPKQLSDMIIEWGGLLFIVALIGAVLYVKKGRMGEVRVGTDANTPSRLWRFMLVSVLCGSALLAPAYQIKIHTAVSLHKHIGYGLLFAAAIAGVGVTRLVGAHFKYPQLGIIVGVIVMVFGMAQASWNFGVWPNSDKLISTLKPYVNERGHYLSDVYEVPAYYLQDQAKPSQWTGTYFIDYKGAQGDAGYKKAIEEGYFDVVVLDGGTQTVFKPAIEGALKEPNSRYRLRAKLKYETVNGDNAYDVYVKQ
jgi:hypothetical protein